MTKNLLSLFLLAVAFDAHSQIILRQDFSLLNVGKLDGQNGWTNNSSNGGTGGAISGAENVSVSSAALSYANYGNATKSIEVKQIVEQDGPGHKIATPITSGTYFFSFLGNFSAYPTGTNFYDILRMLNGGAFTTSARIWVQPGITAAGFKVGIKIGDSVSPAGVTTSDYSFNQTHLFVVKYVIGPGNLDDKMVLYIDPVFASGEPANPTLTAPTAAFEYADNIDRVAFPYNTPKAGKATGKIGLVSVARTWAELDFPETLATNEINASQNVTAHYSSGEISLQQTGFNNAELRILTADGRLIYKAAISSEKNQKISTGQLNKGIYFLILQNGKDTITKKIISNN